MNTSYETEQAAFRAAPGLPDPDHLAELQSLLPRMRDIGFVESEIEAALGVKPFTFRRQIHLPVYRARLRDKAALGLAIRFWLLHESLSLEELQTLIGDRGIAGMHRLGWLAVGSRGISSRVHLYPCCGLYLFTDLSASLDPWPEQVYWLGEDSYTLAYCTPRTSRRRSLDVCTGSGVHALLARRHCDHSEGLDINQRALQFSRLNAALNGLDVQFFESNALAEAQGQVDLVTLNPPFAPAPTGTSELYRAGGSTGEAVTESVVKGLDRILEPGGLFSMATEAPRVRGGSPLDRMEQWLGPGWGVAALYKHEFALEDYILSHVMASLDYSLQNESRESERWLEVYLENNITSMVAAQFYAVRGAKSWRAERSMPTPTRDVSGLIADWLSALQSDLRDFRVHDQVQGLYYGEHGVVVEFAENGWSSAPVRFGPEHARTLQNGTGPETCLRDLAEQLVIVPAG